MEPLEIRTTPVRLPPLTVGATVILVGVSVYLLWLGAATTVLAARHVPEDRSQLVICAGLLLTGYVMTWIYLRMFAPFAQTVFLYLFRDRGKQVVAYRLDNLGWRRVSAGSDVLIPWAGMAVTVTARTEDWYYLRIASDGPFAAARDPLSRRLRRDLRKERGFVAAMTTTNPTEDELAAAIERHSAGRVTLVR